MMPNCSNIGCAIIGSDPDYPKTVMTVHGPECEIYKFVIPVDPRCTCPMQGGQFHSMTCAIFHETVRDEGLF